MAETYYIRLPFYLLNGSSPRSIDISFDNALISTAEITATDNQSMNYVNFSVTKDPGSYTLKLTPKVDEDYNVNFTNICMDDVWVSKDNTTFYSVLLNGSLENPIVKTPTSDDYGFTPAAGASLYNDIEMTIQVYLPDATNWTNVYKITSIENIKAACDNIIANGTEEEKLNLLPKIQKAYDLFKARGYN